MDYIIENNDSVKLLTLGRKAVISHETLFRVIVYGEMKCIYSSCELEKVCKRDVNFIFLLQG